MDAKSAAVRSRQANGTSRTGEGDDLTEAQLRELLESLQSMKVGDFSARLPGDWTGVFVSSSK